MSTPSNLSGALYSPEQNGINGAVEQLSYHRNTCPPPGTAGFIMPGPAAKSASGPRPSQSMRYSPGDRLNIFIFGSTEFSGDYAVNADGRVILPYAGEVEAVGLTNSELSTRIERSLVRAGIFQPGTTRINVRPMQYAPVNVTVSGAVFLQGRHAINHIPAADKQDKVIAKYGDSPMDRFVPAALRAAGGVRPDADLTNVKVVRAGRVHKLNWRGAITGAPVDDMPLIEGDHVHVEEADCFQSALVRPVSDHAARHPHLHLEPDCARAQQRQLQLRHAVRQQHALRHAPAAGHRDGELRRRLPRLQCRPLCRPHHPQPEDTGDRGDPASGRGIDPQRQPRCDQSVPDARQLHRLLR